MPPGNIIRPVDIHEFEVSRDKECADLLARWVFYQAFPPFPRNQWPASARDVADAIEALVPTLLEPGLDACLGLFGPFVPGGIIGAAALLISEETGGQYFLPSVECDSSGPGYVETYMSIAWRPGVLARLFLPAPVARNGFLPCDLRASIVICPRNDMGQVRRHAVFDADLRANRATQDLLVMLRSCTFAILPDLDFECSYLGAAREKASVAERALLHAWERG